MIYSGKEYQYKKKIRDHYVITVSEINTIYTQIYVFIFSGIKTIIFAYTPMNHTLIQRQEKDMEIVIV